MDPQYKRKHGVITVVCWNTCTYKQYIRIILQYTDNHWVWAKISEHLHVFSMELYWGNDVNAIDGGENDINFDSYWCFWWVQVKKHAPSTIFDREYEVWYGGMRKRILFFVHFTCIAWINLPFATFQRKYFSLDSISAFLKILYIQYTGPEVFSEWNFPDYKNKTSCTMIVIMLI